MKMILFVLLVFVDDFVFGFVGFVEVDFLLIGLLLLLLLWLLLFLDLLLDLLLVI